MAKALNRAGDEDRQETGATVLVTSSYPITGDGSEAAGSFVRDLAHELARHGPCRVVAPGNQNDVENETKSLTVYRYRAPHGLCPR